jgi:hypothetical protein
MSPWHVHSDTRVRVPASRVRGSATGWAGSRGVCVCHRPKCVTRGFHRRPDLAAGHLHCIINSIAARSSIARRGRRHSSAGLVSSSMLRPPRGGHAHTEDTGIYGHPPPCRGARILVRSRSSRGSFSGAAWMICPAPHQIAGMCVLFHPPLLGRALWNSFTESVSFGGRGVTSFLISYSRLRLCDEIGVGFAGSMSEEGTRIVR